MPRIKSAPVGAPVGVPVSSQIDESSDDASQSQAGEVNVDNALSECDGDQVENEPEAEPPLDATMYGVEVPVIELRGYTRRRIDVALSSSQAQILRGVEVGLQARQATLENGKPVSNQQDAFKWILENLVKVE